MTASVVVDEEWRETPVTSVGNRVAVIGLGRMGRAMATRLAEQGAEVAVWNRTPARAEEVGGLIGSTVLGTAAEAGSWPHVVVSLADDEALLATYRADDGLLAGLRPGTTVIETSTVDPRTIEQLAVEVGATGAQLLDAPVSGSVPAVEGGTLTFMVGGDEAALERAEPVLLLLGARIFHLGATGTGAAMKLAVNAVVHALNATVSESLVLAEAAGIGRTTAYEVLASSVAGAPFLHYKRAAFEAPHDTPTAFSLDLVAKDLALIHGFAERLGSPAPQVATNLRVAREAVQAGLGDRDMTWLAERFRGTRRP
jgi:3-hydroxyisobutyrate dehydrogenase-like beta-hydroxyacid dehydrogenase